MDDTGDMLRVRFLILGALAVLIFGMLGVRLWSLQLLQGKKYTLAAASNTLRTSTTAATRGRIFDRNGVALVTNRSSMTVIAPTWIKTDDEVLDRLSTVLKMSKTDLINKLNNARDAPLDPHVLAIDVPMDKIAYISEHATQFPGVAVQASAVRQYPQGALAAQVLGYTGAISDDELHSPSFRGYQASDIVGKSGAEAEFEKALQGVRGTTKLEVDADGIPKRTLSTTPAQSGEDVHLTIDAKVQKQVEEILVGTLQIAQKKGAKNAKAASAVALDTKTGDVIAMASLPSYDPSLFIGGISSSAWTQLTASSSEYPLTNRAISAMYPPASTFKSFVALAALSDGLATPYTSVDCQGRWTGLGAQWGKWCWNHGGHGELDMNQAITQSCDSYFYNLGKMFYEKGGATGTPLQDYIRNFGFGSVTGIDLPGENSGRVPTPTWKKAWNADYPELQQWVPGDTVNLSIGQGDMLATPLQMAVAYSAIANDGVVMTPHILKSVANSEGQSVYIYKPQKAKVQPSVSAASLETIHTALIDVTSAASGTASSAFRDYRPQVAGKTGTAQVLGKDDYGWFVGYAPADAPRFCVALVVEQSGDSSVTSPAARQIFEALFGQQVEQIIANDSSR
ncbi:MAG: penicillin-binding protein 2 [Actinomycetia bacterium]|nr:penicillin-binding protein 2 [Actinomycetes bacterium]